MESLNRSAPPTDFRTAAMFPAMRTGSEAHNNHTTCWGRGKSDPSCSRSRTTNPVRSTKSEHVLPECGVAHLYAIPRCWPLRRLPHSDAFCHIRLPTFTSRLLVRASTYSIRCKHRGWAGGSSSVPAGAATCSHGWSGGAERSDAGRGTRGTSIVTPTRPGGAEERPRTAARHRPPTLPPPLRGGSSMLPAFHGFRGGCRCATSPSLHPWLQAPAPPGPTQPSGADSAPGAEPAPLVRWACGCPNNWLQPIPPHGKMCVRPASPRWSGRALFEIRR